MKIMSILNLHFSDYLLIILLSICIITDIKKRRVYNKVLVPFLLLSLAANLAAGGWPLLLDSLKGILLGLAVLIIPFVRGGIGAGDVKLLGVIGGIKGSVFVLSTCLAGALAGGVFALFFLAANRQLRKTLLVLLQPFSNLLLRYGITTLSGKPEKDAKTVYFPYTLAIGAGVIAVYATGVQSLLRW